MTSQALDKKQQYMDVNVRLSDGSTIKRKIVSQLDILKMLTCPVCDTPINVEEHEIARRLSHLGYLHLDLWVKCPTCGMHARIIEQAHGRFMRLPCSALSCSASV